MIDNPIIYPPNDSQSVNIHEIKNQEHKSYKNKELRFVSPAEVLATFQSSPRYNLLAVRFLPNLFGNCEILTGFGISNFCKTCISKL